MKEERNGVEQQGHHHRRHSHADDVAYLPITPQEIAEAAIGAAEAGAAVVHVHARDPQNGKPDQRPEAFAPFLPIIKQRCNAVINLTSGGSPTMRVEERVKPAEVFKPEVASLNMGSINFALYPMLKRYKEFKYDWEKPYLDSQLIGKGLIIVVALALSERAEIARKDA